MTRTSINRNSALTEVEKRRIILVSEAIYSQYYTGSLIPEFRSILTMIMILVQEPLAFFLYKKEEKLLDFLYQFNTHDRYTEEVDEIKNSSDISEKTTFCVFGTDYYLLVLRVSYPERESNVGRAIFSNIRDGIGNEERAAILVDALLSVDRLDTSKESDFKEALYASLAYYSDNKGIHEILYSHGTVTQKNGKGLKIKYAVLNSAYHDLFGEKLNAHKDYIEQLVVSRVYNKIKERSKFLTHGRAQDAQDSSSNKHLGKLPNFILIGRDYGGFLDKECCANGQEYKRKGVYDYRAYFLVCQDQENDFRQYLKRLQLLYKEGNNDPKRDEIIFSISLKSHMDKCNRSDSPIVVLAESLDDYFKSMLISPHGIDEFMTIIKEPFGKRVRSMADPIFSAGVMHFREPFTTSALARCFPDEKITYADVTAFKDAVKRSSKKSTYLRASLNDLKRVVISHYLFLGMSPCDPSQSDKSKSNRIMLSPIEVGGSVYAVTGFFAANAEENSGWEKIFHMNEIHERAERELRRWLEQFHFELVFRSFQRAIQNLKDKSDDEKNSTIKMWELLEQVRTKLSILEYIMPYAKLIPERKDGNCCGGDEDGDPYLKHFSGVFLNDKYCIRFTDSTNEHFPEILGRKIDPDFSSISRPHNYTNLQEIYDYVSKSMLSFLVNR